MAKKRAKSEPPPLDIELLKAFMLEGAPVKDDTSALNAPAKVDLHLDETSRASDTLSNSEKLNVQLKHLEKQIDRAIASGRNKINVIHGKGEGKLKNAVHAFLKNHPQVRSFRILNDRKHDGGTTEVFFK